MKKNNKKAVRLFDVISLSYYVLSDYHFRLSLKLKIRNIYTKLKMKIV